MTLLGNMVEISHQSLEVLKSIAAGVYDDEGDFSMWAMIDKHVDQLNLDNAFSEKVGEIAHKAISHWAKVEALNVQ